jgi:hypothetical protein
LPYAYASCGLRCSIGKAKIVAVKVHSRDAFAIARSRTSGCPTQGVMNSSSSSFGICNSKIAQQKRGHFLIHRHRQCHAFLPISILDKTLISREDSSKVSFCKPPSEMYITESVKDSKTEIQTFLTLSHSCGHGLMEHLTV